MEARNPKRITDGPRYVAGRNCIEVEIFSQAELSSPGHMLGNVSKKLLRAEDELEHQPERRLRDQLVGGKRLFRVESVEVGREADEPELSNYDLLETVMFLYSFLYEGAEGGKETDEREVPKRNQARKIIGALKNVVRENRYVLEEIRGKENRV